MRFSLVKHVKLIVPGLFIVLCNWPLPAAEPPATFVLTISLPTPNIHPGEELVIKEILSNPTDHVVVAKTGLTVELLDEKGNDVGIHATGGKREAPSVYFAPTKVALRPGSRNEFTWRFKPEPGYLTPGVYKLRIHDRDMKSQAEVYSNAVELTVIH